MRYLITGAAGFIGGQVAEACRLRRRDITALVRPGSDTRRLEELGIDIAPGDLGDPGAIQRALEEVEVVIHCAAKVGDGGPLSEYRRANVDNLRLLLDACKGQALDRFVHLSDLSVYPLRDHQGTDETTPCADRHRDAYSQSKADAERLVLAYYHDLGVPVVVLRPGYVYGPGDRRLLPRLVKELRAGQVRYPGGGYGAVCTLFARNLVEAVWTAVHKDDVVGQVFNITDGEHVSKREFVETIADALGLPRPKRAGNRWLAWQRTKLSEGWARLRGKEAVPFHNTARYRMMALDLDFSIEKAKFELGYLPRWSFRDAMEETLAWYRTNAAETDMPN